MRQGREGRGELLNLRATHLAPNPFPSVMNLQPSILH